MVLAAGLGTRLAPLTSSVPKALCPVGDRPQIDHVLGALASAGFARVVVNTHHLASQFTDLWRASQPLEVTLVHEPDILGTAGGIANAASALGDGDVLVWNADILAELDVDAFVGAHRSDVRRAMTLATGTRRPASEGTVGLDANDRIARLRGETFAVETSSADYAGIALVAPALRRRLPRPGCLVGDVLMPLLRAGHAADFGVFALGAGFADTGTLGEYLAANLAWLARRGLRSFVHASGSAREASLDRSIVGAGATVAPGSELVETVVWPGATAKGRLLRAVVTPSGIVSVP
jgi:mannose-1-phosphate guanylyltransferase